MGIKDILLPKILKNSNTKEWREDMYKICPDPLYGELVSTLFYCGEYYGYVCQKPSGYHSLWVRVCIENLEDMFEKKLLSFFIESYLKIDHKTGKLIVISFDSKCLRVYRSTDPFENKALQGLFSGCWNRWQPVDPKKLVGMPKHTIDAHSVSIINQRFSDTNETIYKAAWTSTGATTKTEQVSRGKVTSAFYMPKHSEGVYLGDGVFIVPEDAWL